MQFHKRTGETCFEVGAIYISVMFPCGTTRTPFKAKEREMGHSGLRDHCARALSAELHSNQYVNRLCFLYHCTLFILKSTE